MQVSINTILDDYFKLRISPKRLSSGRYQVKFFATIQPDKEVYGYLLAESGETLKSVTTRIKKRLHKMQGEGEFGFFHLPGNAEVTTHNHLMIFNS